MSISRAKGLKEKCAKMKLQYRLNFNSTLQLCYAASNENAGCLLNNNHYCYTTLADTKMIIDNGVATSKVLRRLL